MNPVSKVVFGLLLVICWVWPAYAQDDEAAVPTGTDTVLVLDISSSMDGGKIVAAQKASNNVLDIVDAENRAYEVESNRVGLVTFGHSAYRNVESSAETRIIRNQLNQLNLEGSTNIASGLRQAIDMLDDTHVAGKPIIILLTDGQPNIGLDEDIVAAITNAFDPDYLADEIYGLAQEAADKSYCVYTVGFSVESQVDEELLRRIPEIAGCGDYYNATDLSQLADIYVDLRHQSTGDIILQEKGQIEQGEELIFGTRIVPPNTDSVLFTINWPGSRLEALVRDPDGIRVDADYPNSAIDTQNSVTTVVVEQPKAGEWTFGIFGIDVPVGGTTYNAVASIRQFLEVPAPRRTPLYTTMMLGGLTLFGGLMWQRSRAGTGWTMEVREQNGRPYTLPIRRAGVKVGRDSSCQVRLNDTAVSRFHCHITPTKDKQRLNLHDQHSRTGTKRNGKKVEKATLRDHDRIEVGSTILRVFKESG